MLARSGIAGHEPLILANSMPYSCTYVRRQEATKTALLSAQEKPNPCTVSTATTNLLGSPAACVRRLCLTFRTVTLGSRVLGLGFLAKACLTPLVEKYAGSGGGRPPGKTSSTAGDMSCVASNSSLIQHQHAELHTGMQPDTRLLPYISNVACRDIPCDLRPLHLISD